MRQIVRAIRRDKNYCQFMDIFGAMLAIAAHWQIIVQNIAAQILIRGPRKFLIFGESGGSGRLTTTCRWSVRLAYRTRCGSFLSTYLMSCSSRTSHQIVLQCSSNHLPNISPFGRIVIFSELFCGFDPRYFVPLMHLPLAGNGQ